MATPWSLRMFQSAPRVETRGDAHRALSECRHRLFQSAPRVETRGDDTPSSALSSTPSFNPRPASRRGAIWSPSCPAPFSVFQSAPRVETRGDPRRRRPGWNSSCFNPRPASRRGAMPAQRRMLILDWCFNPRPASRRGAINTLRLVELGWYCFNPRPASRRGAISHLLFHRGRQFVSIRAPRRDAGRSSARRSARPMSLFQSAPRVETRGDSPPTARRQRSRAVSIRAPRRDAGRFD